MVQPPLLAKQTWLALEVNRASDEKWLVHQHTTFWLHVGRISDLSWGRCKIESKLISQQSDGRAKNLNRIISDPRHSSDELLSCWFCCQLSSATIKLKLNFESWSHFFSLKSCSEKNIFKPIAKVSDGQLFLFLSSSRVLKKMDLNSVRSFLNFFVVKGKSAWALNLAEVRDHSNLPRCTSYRSATSDYSR